MLSTLRQSIYVEPLGCALPGVAIFITSICFNLVSDGVRGAMDVRRMSAAAQVQPYADPRDRGGAAQPMLIARELQRYFPLRGGAGKGVRGARRRWRVLHAVQG